MENDGTENSSSTSIPSSDQHADQLTLQQLGTIQEEIAQIQPLIGEPVRVEVLLTDYTHSPSPGFIPGIQYLSKEFSYMRKVRGDGNCFYRALLFGYLENLLKFHLSGNEESIAIAKKEYGRIMTIIKDSLEELIALGYPDYAIESFHEVSITTISLLSYIIYDLSTLRNSLNYSKVSSNKLQIVYSPCSKKVVKRIMSPGSCESSQRGL